MLYASSALNQQITWKPEVVVSNAINTMYKRGGSKWCPQFLATHMHDKSFTEKGRFQIAFFFKETGFLTLRGLKPTIRPNPLYVKFLFIFTLHLPFHLHVHFNPMFRLQTSNPRRSIPGFKSPYWLKRHGRNIECFPFRSIVYLHT